MERQKAKDIIGKLDITPEVKRRVGEVLSGSTAAELSAEEAAKVRELLQLEMELLDVKEEVLSELVAAVSRFFEGVPEPPEVDLDSLFQESQREIDKRIREFEDRADADLAALAAKIKGE